MPSTHASASGQSCQTIIPTAFRSQSGLPVIREQLACAGSCLPCDIGGDFARYGCRFVRRRRSA